MTLPDFDFDDPAAEERWCYSQRQAVVDYLKSQQLNHGRIGEWPAWHIVPVISIWAIESLARPEWIGWWVITGDCPADYISASEVTPPQHPRKAVRVIAQRWLNYTAAWERGEPCDGIKPSGDYPMDELAPLLRTRAKLLIEWADDDNLWEGD